GAEGCQAAADTEEDQEKEAVDGQVGVAENLPGGRPTLSALLGAANLALGHVTHHHSGDRADEGTHEPRKAADDRAGDREAVGGHDAHGVGGYALGLGRRQRIDGQPLCSVPPVPPVVRDGSTLGIEWHGGCAPGGYDAGRSSVRMAAPISAVAARSRTPVSIRTAPAYCEDRKGPGSFSSAGQLRARAFATERQLSRAAMTTSWKPR